MKTSCVYPALFCVLSVFEQHTGLFVEEVFFHPGRRLEEGGEMPHQARLAPALRQLREPREDEDERGREYRIIALPYELQRHLGLEKAPEVYEIPCCFLVVKGGHVVYVHA